MVVVTAILAWLFVRGFNNASTSAAPTPSVQLVSTATPHHRLLNATATVPGAWIAREEVAIGSPLEGLRVAEVLVESGDQVVAGQVLARLERTVLDSQARQAEQAARRARAEFFHANEQYQRAQRLMPAGAVSRQDYEAVRATMLAAQAALQQAEAAGEEQRTRRAHAEIRAPFAGTITQRGIQVGAMAGAQSTLFRLASDQPPEFLAQVSQQLLPDLVVGMAALVSTSGRDGVLEGSVRLVGTIVDASTGYSQLRIALAAPPPAFIRPGIVGSVRLKLAPREVLAVDARAVRFGDMPYVFVVDAGHARRTPVCIGLRQDGWVEVISGLDASSRVVIASANLLQDGDPIETQDSEPVAAVSKLRNSTVTRRLLKNLPWQRKSLLASMTADVKV